MLKPQTVSRQVSPPPRLICEGLVAKLQVRDGVVAAIPAYESSLLRMGEPSPPHPLRRDAALKQGFDAPLCPLTLPSQSAT